VGVLLAGCSAAPAHSQGARPARHSAFAAPPASASPSGPLPSASPSVIAVPPPPTGLPQTRKLPSAHTRVFRAEMTDLWTAIRENRPSVAMQSFFPLSAYEQVKAIADPAADWHSRLAADYVLDIRAAHAYLGHGARRAHLVRVIVPERYASWIVPGVCDNKLGYWHVPGSRLVYRQHGQVRSIGIASLISWRGRWYVVHLGAVLRSTAAGVVDQPTVGSGTPGPPGGC
jgi:hypothetical protein